MGNGALSAHDQEAHQTTEQAREDHGANDDAVHLDARIAGGALALTHHGDLIAVLAVFEIYIQEERQDSDAYDGEQVLGAGFVVDFQVEKVSCHCLNLI